MTALLTYAKEPVQHGIYDMDKLIIGKANRAVTPDRRWQVPNRPTLHKINTRIC